ncbi:MAG: amidohydrolase family protein [Pseudomonadota bacterium]
MVGTQGPGRRPEQAVPREDALRMLTVWPTFGAFQERDRGSISVDKYADLSVFDRDLMRAPPAHILEAKTVMTVVGGRTVYQSD